MEFSIHIDLTRNVFIMVGWLSGQKHQTKDQDVSNVFESHYCHYVIYIKKFLLGFDDLDVLCLELDLRFLLEFGGYLS